MPKFLMSALAIAAATLGTVPMAQAQMAPQASDHRMDGDHRGPDRHMDRPGPRGQHMVPRDQSLRLRTEIGELNAQILQAQRARRISAGQASGLRNQTNSLQSRFWIRMRDGMTQGEYGSVSASIRQVRGNLDRIVAQNGRRHR